MRVGDRLFDLLEAAHARLPGGSGVGSRLLGDAGVGGQLLGAAVLDCVAEAGVGRVGVEEVEAGAGAGAGQGDVGPFAVAGVGAEDPGAVDGGASGLVGGHGVGVGEVPGVEVAGGQVDVPVDVRMSRSSWNFGERPPSTG